MSHQTQLEKAKYRQWVKGALSMKYLKDGLEKFTDDVVQNEHTRILQQIKNKPGLICYACSLRDLKPTHKSVLGSTSKTKICPFGQSKCNCLYPKKKSCPNKICDAIYEVILNAHASSPPSPCLNNTDITKWVTHPWEVAKCFINAPGYKDKQSAEEIDVAGLLHVFINNKMYQTSLSCAVPGNMCKVRDLRNKMFHSPNMELEEQDLTECFTNIVTILKDGKILKHNQYAKEAVKRIEKLQNQTFIITTKTEAMILRDIIEQRINAVEVSNIELEMEHTQLEVAHKELENRQSGLEQKHSELNTEHSQLEGRHSDLANNLSRLEQKQSDLATEHSQLKGRHNELENKQSGLEQKQSELATEHSQLEGKHNEMEKKQLGLEQKQSELAKEHSQLEGKHNDLENRQSRVEQKQSELAKGQSQLIRRHNELENTQSGLKVKHLKLAKGCSELEGRHNELENRQSIIEQKHTELDQRLVRVESDVDKLKDLHKNQLTILERRLDARQKLVDYLQKYYVKTSASPLKSQKNEIDIDKVYVKPIIQVEHTDSSDDKQIGKPHTFVKTYSSIFFSRRKRLRRIYLLGEVGSGKSAFCKMMILNWCRSVTNQTEQANRENEIKNIETMKRFDFLFFLPLRRLQGNGRIREMIYWYYKYQIPVEILDDILLNVPEKCVILADGLDEWAPNHDEQRPLHVTDGLPYLEDIEKVTVLTTSRPSAPGVLNMAHTESDKKLVVKGINSIDLMAEKYILLLNSPKRDIKYVLDHLNAIKIGQLEKSPLLLQQLVWMLGNGIEVGKCMSNVYSSLVNIALKWAEEKGSKKNINNLSSCQGSSELHLPKQLMKYEACRSYRNILFNLGKIAFELLVPENNCASNMSFGRGKLNEDGLDDDMIKTLLSIGLLTEDNCDGNIEHRTKFAFAHASFQEYFAALYVASYSKIDKNKSSDAPKHDAREIFLERLFRRYCSVKNILQISVVLRLLCGLAPEIIYDVCEHMYQISQHDSTYSSLRDTYLLKKIFMSEVHGLLVDLDTYIRITQNMQTLITSCILEYNCNEETSLSALPVLDLAIVSLRLIEYLGLFQYIIPQKVLHLTICRNFEFNEGDFSFISDVVFQNLQTIAIECYNLQVSDLFTVAVNKHLLQTLSVRKLKIMSVNPGGPPTIDLSRHHLLVLLNTNCNVVNVDLKNLEVIRQQFEKTDISYMIQVNIAPKLWHFEFHHAELERETTEFAKFVSRNVSMKVIKLHFIYGETSAASIDLSSHDNLQILEIVRVDRISIKSVNTTNLHTVKTDRIDVLHAVRNAQKLTNFKFYGNYFFNNHYTKEMNEVVCSCSQLQEIKLERLTIEDGALEMSFGMRNLKCIKLYSVMISLPVWIQFVNSLLNLRQSVTVRFLSASSGENFREVLKYVTRENKKFSLKTESMGIDLCLDFETVP